MGIIEMSRRERRSTLEAALRQKQQMKAEAWREYHRLSQECREIEDLLRYSGEL